MITSIRSTQSTIFQKIICSLITVAFMSTVAIPPSTVSAQASPGIVLPTPGVMVPLSSAYTPALMMGLEVHPDNPLQFDFIIHRGQSKLKGGALKDESHKLIKYFLASLTVPDEETWVNLSPYEKDQIIPESFGVTEMGRDLLAQDYLLKQLTASLIYPEDQLGQDFWKRVRERAYEEYGMVELPVNTFNKVWIVPDRAEVFEQNNMAYIADSHLKVLLEDDYLALENNSNSARFRTDEVANEDVNKMSEMTAPIVREIILPEIEKEINAGQTFAQLRQVYNSMILATWYKQSLKKSLLGKVYIDQNKVAGIDLAGKDAKLKIYDRYMEAFKKGVYNYIRKDYDHYAQKPVPRKYFSGGISGFGDKALFGSAGTGVLKIRKTFADVSPEGKKKIFDVEEDSALLIRATADIVEVTLRVEEMEAALVPADNAMLGRKEILESIRQTVNGETALDPFWTGVGKQKAVRVWKLPEGQTWWKYPIPKEVYDLPEKAVDLNSEDGFDEDRVPAEYSMIRKIAKALDLKMVFGEIDRGSWEVYLTDLGLVSSKKLQTLKQTRKRILEHIDAKIAEQDYLDKTLSHVAVERDAYVFFVNDGQSPTLAEIAQGLNLEAKQIFALNKDFVPSKLPVVNAYVRLPINDKTSELVGALQVTKSQQDHAMLGERTEELWRMIQSGEIKGPVTKNSIYASPFTKKLEEGGVVALMAQKTHILDSLLNLVEAGHMRSVAETEPLEYTITQAGEDHILSQSVATIKAMLAGDTYFVYSDYLTVGMIQVFVPNAPEVIKALIKEGVLGEPVDPDGKLFPIVKKTHGGIDFNSAHLNLQIKRDGKGVPLPISQQPLEEMQIDGFLPVIINIVPVMDLPLLLGIAKQEEEEKRVKKDLDPADKPDWEAKALEEADELSVSNT